MNGIKRGAVNAGALTVSHGANAVLPLIAFPHLLNVAGAVRYSDVVIAESVSLLVLAISLYSFEVDGVQSVVGLDTRAQGSEIARVFTEVLAARLLLFAGSAVAAVVAVAIISPDRVPLVLAWLTVPLASVLQSSWLFNGLERNLPVSVAVTVSRTIALVAILLLVTSFDRAWLLPLLIGIPANLAAVVLLIYIMISWGIRPTRPDLRSIGSRLRQGRPVFLSSVSVYLYRDLNVLLLGSAGATASAITAYSIAEKIVKGLQSAARPINVAFFPVALRRLRAERKPSPSAFVKIARLTMPQLGFLLALATAGVVAWTVVGQGIAERSDISGLAEAQRLILLMAPVLPFGVANFMFGTVGLNQLGDREYLFKATIVVGVGNVLIGYCAASLWAAAGMAASLVLSEMALFTLIAVRYRVRGERGSGVLV